MTNNLGRTETIEAQNQKEVTINSSDGILDQKLTEPLTLDFTGGAVTLTTDQWKNAAVLCTNVGSPLALNTPLLKGQLIVNNTAGANAVTVTRGTGTVEVPAGEVRTVYQDGTANGLIELGGGGGIDVQEGASTIVAKADTLDFDAAGFNVTDVGGVATVALAGGGGGGGGGGITVGADALVTSQTFSAVASVDIVDLNPQSGETFYAVVHLDASNDDVQPQLRVSDDNGATFEALNYEWALRTGNSSPSAGDDSAGGATLISLILDGVSGGLGNAAGEAFHGVIELGELANTSNYKEFSWQVGYSHQAAASAFVSGAGSWRGATNAINALQLRISAGTMTGRISIYKRGVSTQTSVVQQLTVNQSGGWEVIEAVDFSAVASVDLEGLAGQSAKYDSIMLMVPELSVVTDDEEIRLRLKLNGTYKTTTDYKLHNSLFFANLSAPSRDTVLNRDHISLAFVGASGLVGNAANEGFSTQVVIHNPYSTAQWKRVYHQSTWIDDQADARIVRSAGASTYDGVDATAELEGLRLFTETGNMTGRVIVYGMRKESNVTLDNAPQPLKSTGARLTLVNTLTGGSPTAAPVEWDEVTYNDSWQDIVNDLTPKFYIGPDITFDAAADVDPVTDVITETAHGLATGMGPFESDANGNTLPTGVANATNYWIIADGPNTIKLATSYANAIAGTAVDITADGLGAVILRSRGRMHIPEGVRRIRMTGGLVDNGDLAGDLRARIIKNGTGGTDSVAACQVDTAGTSSLTVDSGVIEVQAGDWFYLEDFGGDAYTLVGSNIHGASFFALEVVDAVGIGLDQILQVQYQEPSGTSGGALNAATWNVRTMNTVVKNTVPGASLATNVITLPAGTYRATGYAQGHRVNSHKTRLRDTTNNVTLVVGSTAFADTGTTAPTTDSFWDGEFTLSGTVTMELQTFVTTTQSNGQGTPITSGEVELYTDLRIEKIA